MKARSGMALSLVLAICVLVDNTLMQNPHCPTVFLAVAGIIVVALMVFTVFSGEKTNNNQGERTL